MIWLRELGIYLYIFVSLAVVTAIHIHLRDW